MKKHIVIQFSTQCFMILANGLKCELMSAVTLNEADPMLNDICAALDIEIKDLIKTLSVFNLFFPNQPERLSEKTSKDDAIV